MKSGQGEEGESGAGEAAVGNALSVGARIRARRKKIGMKQATLAQEAGISAAQLCHLEKNDVQPSIRTLGRIATALGTTVAELLVATDETANRPDAVGPIPGDALASDALAKGRVVANGAGMVAHGTLSPALRAIPLSERGGPKGGAEIEPVTGLWRVHDARDTAVDRRVRARLRKEIESWKKLERAAGITRPSPTLPLFFPAASEFGALLAREIRTAGGIGPTAITDPAALLDAKGFRVVETNLPSGLDSWSLWDPQGGNAFIFLRAAATAERKRFRAAFELGHLARFVSGGFRPLRDIGASRKISRAFAAAFLLPEEAVREAALSLAIGADDWTWELALALKARFGVSAETFLYRIEELGMVSREKNKEFRSMLAAYYARCRESGNRDFEPPAPKGAASRPGALVLRAKSATGRPPQRPKREESTGRRAAAATARWEKRHFSSRGSSAKVRS